MRFGKIEFARSFDKQGNLWIEVEDDYYSTDLNYQEVERLISHLITALVEGGAE